MTSQDLAQFRASELYLARERERDWRNPEAEPHYLGLSSAWDKVREPKRSEVLCWISDRIEPCPHPRVWSAYGKYSLKLEWEYYHHDLGDFYSGDFYVSEGQVKGAMVELGYLPVNPGELSWRFRAKPRMTYTQRSKQTTRGRWQQLPWKRTCARSVGGCGARIEKGTRSYLHQWLTSRFDNRGRVRLLCEKCGSEHERRIDEREEDMRKHKANLKENNDV